MVPRDSMIRFVPDAYAMLHVVLLCFFFSTSVVGNWNPVHDSPDDSWPTSPLVFFLGTRLESHP